MSAAPRLLAATPFALVVAAFVAMATSAPVAADTQDAAAREFVEVVKVLQSPRCVNCHPKGDAPLQGDRGTPHAMFVSRKSNDAGLACNACHRATNSPVRGGPPGAPNWHLPPRATPMVFEGKTPAEICAQVKDPAQNGGKTLAQLGEHFDKDPLVLWGWSPGPGRTTPPMSHDELAGHARRWLAAGAPCPK